MTLSEFWQQVKAFNKREELAWARTYRLWTVHISGEKPSFDQFMGRAPVMSKEEKFEALWELIECDREKGREVTVDA